MSVVGGLGDVLVACGLGASELAAGEEVPDCSAVLVVSLPLVVLVLSSAKFVVTQNKILTKVQSKIIKLDSNISKQLMSQNNVRVIKVLTNKMSIPDIDMSGVSVHPTNVTSAFRFNYCNFFHIK